MPKKSAKRAKAKLNKLKAKVQKLQGRLDKAEAGEAGWKEKAKRFDADAQKSAKKLSRAKKKLRKADAAAPIEDPPAVEAAAPEPDAPAAADVPDDSWTVTRLRAAAREAGVPGYSRMNRAALLGSLT